MTERLDLASAAAIIDDLRRERRHELLALLEETSPIYAGRSASDAERLRAYVLVSFAEGLPIEQVLPFALEQIVSGHDPFAVAAAAKALRNTTAPPDRIGVLLVEAIRRLKSRDSYVWHDELTITASRPPDRTMLMELADTLLDMVSKTETARIAAAPLGAMLDEEAAAFHPRVRGLLERALWVARNTASEPPATGAAAHTGQTCCGAGRALSPLSLPDRHVHKGIPPVALKLQDQDGSAFSFGDFFKGHVSAVVFFYTRCENPEKCSLTIANLAQLQRLVYRDPSLQNVRLAAFTYDAAFDTPERLKAYGRDRGVQFDRRTKLLRTIGPLDPVATFFELGVSFGETTVNLHRLELAVLGRDMEVIERVVRQKWQPEKVVKLIAEVSSTC